MIYGFWSCDINKPWYWPIYQQVNNIYGKNGVNIHC